MPRRFRDSRSRMTASTAEAPLLNQRIPIAAFNRGAGVSPGRRSRQRTAPARNRPEAQDPWQNRRPSPAKLPRILRGATAMLSIALSLALVTSMCPATALATSDANDQATTNTTITETPTADATNPSQGTADNHPESAAAEPAAQSSENAIAPPPQPQLTRTPRQPSRTASRSLSVGTMRPQANPPRST